MAGSAEAFPAAVSEATTQTNQIHTDRENRTIHLGSPRDVIRDATDQTASWHAAKTNPFNSGGGYEVNQYDRGTANEWTVA